MIFKQSKIPDILIISPEIYKDKRGYFYESYNVNRFSEAGLDYEFRQDNESKSKKDVLRGLHFQIPPFEQGKLVRVVKGAIIDVAVDLRIGSPFYGKWCSEKLTENNKLMMWIPPGFAHGFISLEADTIFLYKTTQVYHKPSEVCIHWNDPDLAIDWGVKEPMVAERDEQALLFSDFKSPFNY